MKKLSWIVLLIALAQAAVQTTPTKIMLPGRQAELRADGTSPPPPPPPKNYRMAEQFA